MFFVINELFFVSINNAIAKRVNGFAKLPGKNIVNYGGVVKQIIFFAIIRIAVIRDQSIFRAYFPIIFPIRIFMMYDSGKQPFRSWTVFPLNVRNIIFGFRSLFNWHQILGTGKNKYIFIIIIKWYPFVGFSHYSGHTYPPPHAK